MNLKNVLLAGLMTLTTLSPSAWALEEREVKLWMIPYKSGKIDFKINFSNIIVMNEKLADTLDELSKRDTSFQCKAKIREIDLDFQGRTKFVQLFSLRDCR
jgi:hypothetical protein